MSISLPQFRSILGTPRKDIEPPKPLPTGTYTVRVNAHKELSSKGENPRPIIEFPLSVIAAGSDVDEDQLEEFGGIEKVIKQKARVSFWLADDDGTATLHRLNEFLEKTCGISQEEDQTLGEAISRANGCIIKAHFKHRIDKTDPTKIYAEVDMTSPLDD